MLGFQVMTPLNGGLAKQERLEEERRASQEKLELKPLKPLFVFVFVLCNTATLASASLVFRKFNRTCSKLLLKRAIGWNSK
ncbi:hypothetical protein Hanom_Chr12g01124061 [Helianthus anomalus]